MVIVVAPPSIYPPVYPCHFFPQPSSLLLLLLVLVLVLHLLLLLLRQCIPVTSSANHPLYFSFIPSISEQPSPPPPSHPSLATAMLLLTSSRMGKARRRRANPTQSAPLFRARSHVRQTYGNTKMQYQPDLIISPDDKLLDRGGSTPSHLSFSIVPVLHLFTSVSLPLHSTRSALLLLL